MKMLFLFSLIFFLCNVSHAQSNDFQKDAEKFLREFSVKVENGEATDRDWVVCQNLWRMMPTDEGKRVVLGMGAIYLRKVLKNPAECVKLVLAELVEKSAAEKWAKENSLAVRDAQKAYKQEVTKAKKEKSDLPSKPKTILTELPPLENWNIHAGNAMLAVEVANALLDEGSFELSMEIVDVVGQRFSNESRVLAAETGGDLFVQMHDFDRSVEFYEFSLKSLNSLKKKEYELGKGDRTFFSEEQKFLKSRIEKKLESVKKVRDEDRYGPDWVAYKEAQKAHFAKDYLKAYWLYQKVITTYPKSIYAEASRCYRIKILTQFADETNLVEASKLLQSKQKELSELRRKLLIAKRSKNSELAEKCQSEIDELAAFLQEIQTIPTKLAALELAEKEAEKFIADDETGLYRAEVMLEIGLTWLHIFLEPDKAEAWLQRTKDWLERTQNLQTQVAKFQIPDKSSEVSQPPKTTFSYDRWGNQQKLKPKAGDLVNRLSCEWYLSDLTAQTHRFLGFLAFYKKDASGAKEHFRVVREADMRVAHSYDKGEPNMYDRFVYYCEQGHLRKATPEDLKSFKGRQRFIIILADFYATVEDGRRAMILCQDFFDGKFGKYNKAQEAYIRFALGWALWFCGVTEQNLELQERSRQVLSAFMTDSELQKQPIAARALSSYANAVRYANTPELMWKSLEIFKFIQKNYRKTPFYEGAVYNHAVELHYLAKTENKEDGKKEAVRLLEQLQKDYPDGRFSIVAGNRLREWREE